MCAFWDGESWAEQELDTDAAFWGVAVSPDGRIWTAGPRAPICRHSLDEWEVVATSPVPILSVAFWNDAVWLAAGEFGLFGLGETGVVQLDKEVPALRFEARGNLIALAEDALLDTADGESFRRVSLRVAVQARCR